MFFKLSNGNQLFYELTGPEQGETILCLNGLSQTTAAWKAMREALGSQYRFLVLDLIFQGQSDKDSSYLSLEGHAENVIDLLSSLQLNKVHLLGISFGGFVAQRIMALYPNRVNKAILLATFAHKSPRFRHIEKALHAAINIGGLELMIQVMYPLALSEKLYKNPPLPIEILIELTLELNETQAIQKLMDAVLNFDDYRKNLENIEIPTLVIHGEDDAFCAASLGQELANSLQNSVFKVIPKAGHTLNVEAVIQITDYIRKFL